jgi:glutathione S-transferase
VVEGALLTLYGSSQGRPSRSLIALEELSLPYTQVPMKPWENAAEARTLAALNPNARVPVLDDDGLVIWESMAINLYLGDRYGGPFWPADARDRARLYQWSLWSQTSLDVMARHRARFSKDPATKAHAEAERLAALAILDAALADRPYLLGETFTLADLNVAATLSEPWETGRIDGDLEPAAHGLIALADWLERCTSRPSWAKVRSLP